MKSLTSSTAIWTIKPLMMKSFVRLSFLVNLDYTIPTDFGLLQLYQVFLSMVLFTGLVTGKPNAPESNLGILSGSGLRRFPALRLRETCLLTSVSLRLNALTIWIIVSESVNKMLRALSSFNRIAFLVFNLNAVNILYSVIIERFFILCTTSLSNYMYWCQLQSFYGVSFTQN